MQGGRLPILPSRPIEEVARISVAVVCWCLLLTNERVNPAACPHATVWHAGTLISVFVGKLYVIYVALVAAALRCWLCHRYRWKEETCADVIHAFASTCLSILRSAYRSVSSLIEDCRAPTLTLPSRWMPTNRILRMTSTFPLSPILRNRYSMANLRTPPLYYQTSGSATSWTTAKMMT